MWDFIKLTKPRLVRLCIMLICCIVDEFQSCNVCGLPFMLDNTFSIYIMSLIYYT